MMESLIDRRQRILEKMDKYEKYYGMPYDYEEFPAYSKATTPFRPYRDSAIDLGRDPLNDPMEHNTEVDDFALGSFINKVLTNQAVALSEGKEYHEGFDDNFKYDEGKIPDMYKVRSSTCGVNDRLPKKKVRSVKRSRGRRSKIEEEQYEMAYGDLPAGSELSSIDGEPMVNLSVAMLRQYMFTEVEARVRYINDYYQRQWDLVNKERLATLGELIQVQESSRQLQKQLDTLSENLKNYKKTCDTLGSKVETSKEAKRRRRHAKKQRKNERSAGSDAEPNDGGDNKDASNHDDDHP